MVSDYLAGYGIHSVDFDQFVEAIKANGTNGVISGLAVAQRGAGANMSVDVASGKARVNGTIRTFSSTTNVVISASDPTNPRKDLIVINSAGTLIARTGTAAAADPVANTKRETFSPDPPEMTAGDIVLAEVWVGAGVTSILTADISDRSLTAIFPNNIRVANEFPGADIGAQVGAANTDIGGATPGVIIVQPGTYTWSTAASLSDDRVVILYGTFITNGSSAGTTLLTMGNRSLVLGGEFTGGPTGNGTHIIITKSARIIGTTFSGTATTGEAVLSNPASTVDGAPGVIGCYFISCNRGITTTGSTGLVTFIANNSFRACTTGISVTQS